MACYRKGGCGPYEMYSCYECPASKPEYALKYEQTSSNANNETTLKEENLKDIALEICNTEIGMFEELKKRLKEVETGNETGIVSAIQNFFNANANIMSKLSELEKKVFN